MMWRRKNKQQDDTPRVEVEGVERAFGSGDRMVRVLRGLDLTVMPGQLVALYGPSGSGKTTLLNLIGALDRPTAGVIEVNGRNIVKMRDGARTRLRRRKIGFIFQSNTLITTYTAMENIDLALRLPGLGFLERRRRAKSALEAVGLAAWSSHMPEEMSGGQRQRVAIARALATRPELVLADEPTSGLDTKTSRRILSLFRGIAESQKTTFLIVSHDPIVIEYVDAAYDLHDGKLVRRISDEVGSAVVKTSPPQDPVEEPVLEGEGA
ncbi:MAG: ABC transporter ATP-binding protein [Anaerolineae bacterium]